MVANKTTSVTLRWALRAVNDRATHGTRFKLSHSSDGESRSYTLEGATADGKREVWRGKAKEINLVLEALRWVYAHSPESRDKFLADHIPVPEVMRLLDVLRQVNEWQAVQFPDAHRNGITAHLAEEAKELAKSPDSLEELADVLILLNGLVYTQGLTLGQLTDAIASKLEVNKGRAWGKADANGVINHVREEPQEPLVYRDYYIEIRVDTLARDTRRSVFYFEICKIEYAMNPLAWHQSTKLWDDAAQAETAAKGYIDKLLKGQTQEP